MSREHRLTCRAWHGLLVTVCASFLLTVEGSAGQSQGAGPASIKTVTTRGELRDLSSWQQTTVTIVTGERGGTPAKDDRVPAWTVIYRAPTPPGMFQLALVQDPRTRLSYVIRGNQTFYVSESSDLLACQLATFYLIAVHSYFRSEHADSRQVVIDRFVSTVIDDRLSQLDHRLWRIDLRQGVPFEFFTAGSLGGAQPGTPTVTSVVMDGAALQLEVMSAGGKYKGTFWIDLNAQQLLRSSVDGKVVYTK